MRSSDDLKSIKLSHVHAALARLARLPGFAAIPMMPRHVATAGRRLHCALHFHCSVAPCHPHVPSQQDDSSDGSDDDSSSDEEEEAKPAAKRKTPAAAPAAKKAKKEVGELADRNAANLCSLASCAA